MTITTREILFLVLVVVYFFYTLTFAIYFHRTASHLYTPFQRRFHSVMMWLLPIIWVFIIKGTMGRPAGGLRERRNLQGSREIANDNNLANSWVLFLHAPDHTPDSHSHGGGHESYGGVDFHDSGGDHGGADSSASH
jgi:hypothetical protein